MLAVVQTEGIKAALQKAYPDPSYEFPIITMTTAGDNNQTTPLYLLSNPGTSSSGPAKSLWTEELELALVEGKVDVIVHCVKDMPTTLPEGCELACMTEREDPRDALVVKAGLPYKTLDELPEGSVIGTSSVRRTAQLSRNYPKLKFMSVRGNL
jgi:hydroxymethylbilane synthase